MQANGTIGLPAPPGVIFKSLDKVSALMRFRMISAAGSACVGLLLLAPQLFPAYAAQTEAVPAAESGTAAPAPKGDPEPEPTFPINEFLVEGNTLFSTDRFSDILDDMAGSERTAADVERARDALEKFYHDQGYPTVLVNIPEQSAEGGAIRLQVIESRISSTTVLGNRHFPTVQVLRALPSLAPGAVLYVPDVEREIGKLNRNPDLKVIPAMTAGKQLGTVEVELKVEDKSPFHGFLELNNRNSPNTSALRLNAGLHYDNLWSRGHSLSFQYQLSPEKPKEVEVFSGSYTLPAPWNADRTLVLYGVSSDSNTAFGEGFHTVGKGSIVGTRYVVPLASVGAYSHSAVLGVDYKNFREVTGSGAGGVTTPVEYLPFSLTYSGSRPDSGGLIFSAGSGSGEPALSSTGSLEVRGMNSTERLSPPPRPASGLVLTATSPCGKRQVKWTPTFSPGATPKPAFPAAQAVSAHKERNNAVPLAAFG